MNKRIWGWFLFDWASQPFSTLTMAFIFAPYFTSHYIGDGVQAQQIWSVTTALAGLLVALSAPIVGALAGRAGASIRWMAMLSVLFVVSHSALWLAAPGVENYLIVLGAFMLAYATTELATVVNNGIMPKLGRREEMGRLSGFAWGFGYLGGLVALALFLALFAESGDTGQTMLARAPAFGLDPELREGTRAVGPLTALWFALFMIPYFLWVREDHTNAAPTPPLRETLRDLGHSIRALPATRSMFAYLGSSMLYRDALNGIYLFCGIYAAGVLGWSVTETGVFGILALIAGIAACWVFARFDDLIGPKPVIIACLFTLILTTMTIISITETRVFFIKISDGSALPNLAFYLAGLIIGAAGGVLQSSSRVMMLRQANPARIAEGFGLYATSGRATAFLAPLLIWLITKLTGDQRLGMLPLVLLFAAGLCLLWFVHPDGEPMHDQTS